MGPEKLDNAVYYLRSLLDLAGPFSGIAPGCSSGVPPVAGSANIVSASASV
jgi:hypothetical protein